MRSYAELNALPAEAYLNPDNFRTEYDDKPGTPMSSNGFDYRRGLKQGADSWEVGICANGTWYARGKDGASVTSCEGIGYHAGTADFWRGVLDSGCNVFVYRGNRKIRIKDAGNRDYWLYSENGLWARGADLIDLMDRAVAAGLRDYMVFPGRNGKMGSEYVAIGGNGLHTPMI